MQHLDRLLEGVLEELHGEFDGQPMDEVVSGARERLEESLLDPDEVLEVFLDELRPCRRCGSACHVFDMERVNDGRDTHFFCEHCL